MNSSIFNFKFLLTLFFIIFLLESLIFSFSKPQKYSNNFFEINFNKPNNIAKTVIFKKFEHLLEKKNYDIISIGDSSGFYGFRAELMSKKINKNIYNFNCCGDVGYQGYLNLAELALKNNKNLEYLFLIINPYQDPSFINEHFVFSDSIRKNFIGPNKYLNYIPSSSNRLLISNMLYYHEINFNPKIEIGSNYNVSWNRYVEGIDKDNGWVPFLMKPNLASIQKECKLLNVQRVRNVKQKVYNFYRYYSGIHFFPSFFELAKKYNTKLVVIFHPVACNDNDNLFNQNVKNDLRRFKLDYPQVEFLFPLINRNVNEEYFMDKFHLNEAGSIIFTENIIREFKRKNL